MNKCSCPYDWQWQLGVVLTWFTWIEVILLSAQFQFIGLLCIHAVQSVDHFPEVYSIGCFAYNNIWFFILFPSLSTYSEGIYISLACHRVHCLILHDATIFQGSPFYLPGSSMLRILTMTVGEVNSDSFFGYNIDGEMRNETHLPYFGLSTFLWLMSLIIMTIILANLLVSIDSP